MYNPHKLPETIVAEHPGILKHYRGVRLGPPWYAPWRKALPAPRPQIRVGQVWVGRSPAGDWELVLITEEPRGLKVRWGASRQMVRVDALRWLVTDPVCPDTAPWCAP